MRATRNARTMGDGGVIAFGDFRLDLAGEMLTRAGAPVALSPKSYGLLRHFLAHPGMVLTKDVLLDAVWPGAEVGDAVLKVCVAELRRALGDASGAPRYVATVHRQGYRFIAELAFADHDGDEPRAAPCGLASGIVGREAPLADLERAFGVARGGERQVVFVTGEAGIGKTTLVDAFLGRLDPTVRRARGHCLEHVGAGEPYGPWLEALGRLAADPAVHAHVTRFAPTWGASLPGTARPAASEIAASRSRMLLELAESLEALSRDTPIVLVLEDLHWSDPSTLDVLALLAQRPEPARLLVVATYRPVELVVHEHPLRGLKLDLALRRKCREVAIEFLTERDVERYLALRLATERVPEGLAVLVHARTDGNPLFVAHLVDLFLEREWLRATSEGWRLETDPQAADTVVPDTLRQMIAAAIDALAPEAQRVLEAASIAGAEPSAAAIAAALAAPLGTVEDTLVDLAQHRRLVEAAGTETWPDGTRSARVAFIHALHRDVLHERVPADRRRVLHARIGARLESGFGAAAAAIAVELARHFTIAEDAPRAVVHLRRAGERAIDRHAYPEGIGHLEHALALVAHEPDEGARAASELDLRMRLGPALMAVHGFAAPDVERCYARARALCATVGVTPARARAVRGLGIFSLARGELVEARVLAEESLALAEAGGAATARGKAHVTMGTVLYYLGELAAAAAHLERGRRSLGRGPDDPVPGTIQAPLVNCLAFLALARWFGGRPDTALALAEEARRVAEALGHPLSRLWAAHVTAVLHHLRGEPDRAAAVAPLAIRLASDLGLRQWTAWGIFFDGWVATLDGRTDDGLRAMQAGLDEYRATGAELGRVYFTATLAEAHARAGDAVRARTLLDEAMALTTARSERYFTAELHRLRAGLLGDPAAAEAELRRAVALAKQQGNYALALRAATDLSGRLGGGAGRRLLTPILQRFREGRTTADVRAADAALAALAPTRPVRAKRVVTPARRRGT